MECICNNWYPIYGIKVANVGQQSVTTTHFFREPSWSGSRSRITRFTEGWGIFLDSPNACPPVFLHSLVLVSLKLWWSDLALNPLIYLFIWEIYWRGSGILVVMRNQGWRFILCLENSAITSWLWSVAHSIAGVSYIVEDPNLSRLRTRAWYRFSNIWLVYP